MNPFYAKRNLPFFHGQLLSRPVKFIFIITILFQFALFHCELFAQPGNGLWQAVGADTVTTNRQVAVTKNMKVQGMLYADSIRTKNGNFTVNDSITVKAYMRIEDSVRILAPLKIGENSLILDPGTSQTGYQNHIYSSDGPLYIQSGETAFPTIINSNHLNGVGIGPVLWPEAKLHVIGTFKLVDGTQGINKVLMSDANGLASWQSTTSLLGPTGATGAIGSTGSPGIQGTTGAQGANGPKGSTGTTGPIGSTGPAGSANAWGLTGNAGTTAGTNFIGTTDARDFVIKTGGSGTINERLRVLSTGNIGISNTSPTQKLSIGSLTSTSTATPHAISLGGTYSSIAAQNLKLRLYEDGTNVGGFGISANQVDYVLWNTAAKHVFYSLTTPLMTILGTGHVGIGTMNPANSDGWQRVLEVKGTDHAKCIASSTSIETGIFSHEFGFWGAPAGGIVGTRSSHPISFVTNAGAKAIILPNGNVGIGTTASGQRLTVIGNIQIPIGNQYLGSDKRFKTNIDTISNAIEKIKLLSGVYFDWDSTKFDSTITINKTRQIGFLAQDVEPILPEVIFVDDSGKYSMDYTRIIPVLVQGMKEQQVIIDSMFQLIAQTAPLERKGNNSNNYKKNNGNGGDSQLLTQITLEHTFPQNPQMTYRRYAVQFSDGTKYVAIDYPNLTLTLYNLDYTIYKTITLVIPNNDPLFGDGIFYISDKLFDLDDEIEYVVGASDYSFLRIYNEDGSILWSESDCSAQCFIGWYSQTDDKKTPILKTDSGFKMIVHTNCQSSSYPDGCVTKVYGLPGSIALNSSGLELYNGEIPAQFKIYPNPSGNSAIIEYVLPHGESSGEIVLTNLMGSVVKKVAVGSGSGSLQLDNTQLPPGTYFYQLQTSKGVVGTKKMIILR